MSYTVTATGAQTVTCEDFTTAREVADKISADMHVEAFVSHTELKVLAYQTSAHPAAHGIGHFSPWTRIEVTPRAWAPKHIEGYTLAYHRVRIQAGVYRPNTAGQPWIIDTPTSRYEAKDTKAACQITKRLGCEARGLG